MKLSVLLFSISLFSVSRSLGQSQAQNNARQIKWFFPGAHLPKSYQFQFPQKFEEVNLKTSDSAHLNALLFKAENSKGVILYLHRNSGALKRWGGVSSMYTNLGYDVFILDYRGYGKSSGQIESEGQLFSDVQTAYNYLKTR